MVVANVGVLMLHPQMVFGQHAILSSLGLSILHRISTHNQHILLAKEKTTFINFSFLMPSLSL
jgi:hypothetical protein